MGRWGGEVEPGEVEVGGDTHHHHKELFTHDARVGPCWERDELEGGGRRWC